MKKMLWYTFLLAAMLLAGCWTAWGIENMNLWAVPGTLSLVGLLRLTCWSLSKEEEIHLEDRDEGENPVRGLRGSGSTTAPGPGRITACTP